jgi:hypothetical protein
MYSKEEIVQAKEILSARLLAAGVRSNVMSLNFTSSMREAVANIGANVHAVGVGRKIVRGAPTDELAVRIYVVQKFAESAIPPRDLLPAQLDGIACDVIESPPAFIQPTTRGSRTRATPALPEDLIPPVIVAASNCTDDRRTRQRAFGAGISVAHRDVTAGTIGYFCRSTRPSDNPNAVYILSNNHVLANVNQGVQGDEILQPGPADGGSAADLVASLERFVRIKLGGDVSNRVDGAIARLIPGMEHDVSICSIGGVTGTDRGVEDMLVRKHGRTTGLTDGIVTDESVNSLVGMDHTDPSIIALFQGQMRIEGNGSTHAFGLGGDSGSLVVSRDSLRAVGLYFAGPDNGVYGLACHINDVLDELEIELTV